MRRLPGRRLAVAAAGALLVATSASACASLPTSGSIRLRTLHGSGGPAQLGVQVLPVPPGPDWTPAQIVRGFIAASASFTDHHAVARQYLTHTYAARWRPGWAATIIGAAQVSKVPTPDHFITTGGALDEEVKVSSRYLARMTTTKRYEASNLVVLPGPESYAFALTQNGGAWRIADIYLKDKPTPKTLLLLNQSDFERDYQPRNLYYLPAGPATNSLIPEPVYIPEQASGSQGVRGIVRSLLSRPPGTSWLFGAADTAFPHGTRLLGQPQVISGIKAVVDLGGAAAKASFAQRNQMAAQLYWSLTASPYVTPTGTQIRSVVLELNHRIWRQLTPPIDASWVPRVQSGPLYFQAPGANGAPGVRFLTKKGSAPVSLPDGLGAGPFKAIAITPGSTDEAVIAACRGRDVYLMPQWAGTQVVSQRLAAPCTSLSWDSHLDLWATAGGLAYVLPGAGRGSPAKPMIDSVVCPASSCAGAITSLRVAPDGVRVAMIVQSGSGSRVMMGAISKNVSFTYLGQSDESQALVRVGSDISDPTGLTWLDPDHLLVLGRADARTQLYEVPVNGSNSTEVAVPQGVTVVSASWPSTDDLPRIVLAIAGTAKVPGKILISNAGLLNRGWLLAAKGITPVFPG